MDLVFVNRKFEWVWWIWFKIYLDLLFVLLWFFFLGKHKIFFFIGPLLGAEDWALKWPGWARLVGLAGLDRAGLGLGKKIHLINESGPGHRSWTAGWVWVWKNSARTQPVAIPILNSSSIAISSYFNSQQLSTPLDPTRNWDFYIKGPRDFSSFLPNLSCQFLSTRLPKLF